jgi:O-antigen/teichoic acid export membrane protein
MLVGQLLIKVLAFIFNVYVVRRLGSAHYGRYATAIAYVAIFAMFTDLGTSALSVREMARREEVATWMVPDVMALRALLSVFAIAAATASAWLLGKTPDLVWGIFIASCGLLLYALQGPLDSLLIAQERLDYSAAFKVLKQATFISFGTLLLLIGGGYIGLLLASLAGVLATGLASAHVVRRALGFQFDPPHPRRWGDLLRASFPFGLMGVVGTLAYRLDTVFMSFVLTDAAVGWYNVPLTLVTMMLLMAQSLAISIYPSLIKEYNSDRGSIQNTVQRSLRYLLFLSLPLAVGGTLLADRIILLLYGQEFAPAIAVMQVLVWALVPMFLAEVLGRTSAAMHLERKLAWLESIRSGASVVLTVALISGLGVIGASYAYVINRFVRVLAMSILIGPSLLLKENVGPLLRVVSAGSIMGCAVWVSRDAAILVSVDDKIALVLLIGAGSVVYGAAALVLRAITPGELRYVYRVAKRRLGRSGRYR